MVMMVFLTITLRGKKKHNALCKSTVWIKRLSLHFLANTNHHPEVRSLQTSNQPTIMNLKKSKVIGFFSLPHASVAEHNPNGYSLAWQNAPKGAGSCANCGMGILHHVVIRTEDGKTAFIGTDCAERIGGEVAVQARRKLTAEQIEQREAKKQAEIKAYWDKENETKASTIARWDTVRPLVVRLIGSELDQAWFQEFLDGKASSQGHFSTNRYGSCVDTNEFSHAMAAALIQGPLTERMAFYTAKCILGRRVNKNAEEYDALCETLLNK